MTDSDNDKRLIEVEMPLEKISEESRREKNIRKGNISTMHKWWARRPIAASRAAAYASLIPDPGEREERKDSVRFIENLSEWEATTDDHLLSRAKEDIDAASSRDTVRVLDPFSGGGALPLEAKRLGCESHALEFNPVAYLLNKALMEYCPSKADNSDAEGLETPIVDRGDGAQTNFSEEIKTWAKKVVQEVDEELGDLYSENVLGYIWGRTVDCQNPNCDLEIPFYRNRWLDKKKEILFDVSATSKGSFETEICHSDDLERTKKGNRIAFQKKNSDELIVPSEGTVQGGSVTCPACGSSFKAKKTRELGKTEGFGDKLLFVIYHPEEEIEESPLTEPITRPDKKYRKPTKSDLDAVAETEEKLEQIESKWIPDESLPPEGTLGMRANLYGYETWGELFNDRQKLVLATFCKKIEENVDEIANKDDDIVEPVSTFLSFVVGKMANRNSRFSVWGDERIKPAFPNGYFPMEWDYVESNPFSGWTGSWSYSLDYIIEAIESSSYATGEGTAVLGDATRLPYPDNHFDAVLTDPPYYANIPYASLADYFYVWLKRAVGSLFPEEFSTPLSPKSGEIIEDESKHESENEAEEFFERELTKSFEEINRVLTEDGITTIVFAHKGTEAWAQMIRGLLSSGFVVTATWPIHTERHSRPRSIESAALASSVYFVCRRRTSNEVGYYSDVQEELENKVHSRLDYFWDQGIRGADLLVSAIGPATEVFGQYESVKRLSGEKVTVDELLKETQRLVSDYALDKVLEGDIALGNIDSETRFYILFRWAFANQEEDYDEVRKLAQVNNANVDLMERTGILEVDGGDARLPAPQDRDYDNADEAPEQNNLPIAEKIHRAAVLWESGERDALKTFIEEHCMSEEFWRAAQAIAECLPEEESRSQKEKQMLHGLLGYGGQTDFEGAGQSTLEKYTNGGQEK